MMRTVLPGGPVQDFVGGPLEPMGPRRRHATTGQGTRPVGYLASMLR